MIKTVTDIHRSVRARSGAARVRVEADLTNRNQKQQGWKARNAKKINKKEESYSQKACQSL